MPHVRPGKTHALTRDQIRNLGNAQLCRYDSFADPFQYRNLGAKDGALHGALRLADAEIPRSDLKDDP